MGILGVPSSLWLCEVGVLRFLPQAGVCPLEKPSFKPYPLPAGGWGSVRSVGNILQREGVLASGAIALSRHNKVDGYQCNSCAWVKPASPLPFEYCENGVKAVAWEVTAHRCTPEFFAEHTVTKL